AHLPGQVAGHGVDAVGEVLPRPRHTGHLRLPAEPPFRADLARDASHLGGKGIELVDHRVDGFLELADLAADVGCDLLGKIAAGPRGPDFRDTADLPREVARHRVHAVGQVLPGARNAGNLRLAAEPPFGADLARHARYFGGE